MRLADGTTGSVSLRTRVLAYGMLGFSALMVLFGPSVAEFGLGALGCAGRLGSPGSGCGGFASLLAGRLAPWLAAMPPLESGFVLLEQAWALLLVWAALLALSIKNDRSPRAPRVRPKDRDQEVSGVAEPAGRALSFAAQQAQWVRQREREQAEALQQAQQSLSQRLMAEGLFWAALGVLLWALLAGLIVFCLAFGTPLLGGVSAEQLLHTLGCAQPQVTASPWVGLCDFWVERLAPYQKPWVGALLAPMWLFTQFHDLLLLWLGVIVALAALPFFRLGGSAMAAAELPWIAKAGLAVFAVSLLALLLSQFIDLSGWATRPVERSYGVLGIDMLMGLMALGGLLLLAFVAALIGFIVLLILLYRRSRLGRPAASAHAPSPASAGETPPGTGPGNLPRS